MTVWAWPCLMDGRERWGGEEGSAWHNIRPSSYQFTNSHSLHRSAVSQIQYEPELQVLSSLFSISTVIRESAEYMLALWMNQQTNSNQNKTE